MVRWIGHGLRFYPEVEDDLRLGMFIRAYCTDMENQCVCNNYFLLDWDICKCSEQWAALPSLENSIIG